MDVQNERFKKRKIRPDQLGVILAEMIKSILSSTAKEQTNKQTTTEENDLHFYLPNDERLSARSVMPVLSGNRPLLRQ